MISVLTIRLIRRMEVARLNLDFFECVDVVFFRKGSAHRRVKAAIPVRCKNGPVSHVRLQTVRKGMQKSGAYRTPPHNETYRDRHVPRYGLCPFFHSGQV